jgi:hypothetical protein
MPALLPAGQVGSDDEHSDLPDIVTTDSEWNYDDDGDGDGDGEGGDDDEDNPPGLLLKEDHGEEIYYSDEEEMIYSSKCLTCPMICSCPFDISSSQDELIVGETSDRPAPSSNLRKGKRKLEDLLNKTFSHETWKFGKLVQPNQPDSDSDVDDPNIPFDWKSLSRAEKKKKLCEDLHLNDNPILNAKPAQRDRLQDLVVNYSDIFTDGLSYNAGSVPSVPFISARVILDPAKGPHTPYRAAVRVLNPIQRAGLQNKIKTWLSQDIIEESASQWCWPIISVAKKKAAWANHPRLPFLC